MYRAHATVLKPNNVAPTLPNNWPSFSARHVEWRKGEVTFIAGEPGSGKSSLALALAVRAAVPTLYLTADTTRDTVNVRLVSMLTGVDQHRIEEIMQNDPAWASQVLSQASHITFDDNSSPTVQWIEDLLDAYGELWGNYPELIVLDNASDVVGQGESEMQWLAALPRIARDWAQKCQSAMVVLHHTREQQHHGICQPLSHLRGKIGAAPSLVLTLNSHHTPGLMAVSPVKHRHGKPDKDGTDPIWLTYDPASMSIGELGGGVDAWATPA